MAIDSESTEAIPRVEDPSAEEWTPSRGGWYARVGTGAVLLGGLLVIVAVIPGFQASRLGFAAIFAIIGISIRVLLGYAGQISLGHQAFVGIGAFMAGFVFTELELPFLISVPAAALSGGVAALLLGGVALRVRGLYLALVTLSYGAVAERTIFLFRPFTGGGAALPADRPAWAQGDAVYTYVCFAVLALVLFVDWRFGNSKAGRAVQAVRDSERVAASMGISIMGYKLLAFVLSGLIAGLGGGLWAHHAEVVVAAPFTFTLALTFVLMAVVGGLQSRAGVVAGSVFFALLSNVLFEYLHRVPGIRWVLDLFPEPALIVLVIGPALLILTLVSFPGGIGQQMKPIINWFMGKRFDLHAIHEQQAHVSGGSDVRP